MPIINQQSLLLESQNQLRNADKLARDWAIAHAGRYQGQARRELRGSAQFQEWKRENLRIRVSKPLSPGIRQGQIVSVHYGDPGDADSYTGYLMTGGLLDGDGGSGGGGFCISVLSVPEGASNDSLPWDDKAGAPGMDALLQAIQAERAKGADGRKDGDAPIAGVDDLFTLHDAAIVLTEEGQNDEAFLELAASHDDWARIVEINAMEQLVVGRELTFQQVGEWIWAKLAVFNRYADANGSRVRLIETDPEKAGAFLDAERDRIVNGIAHRNSLTLLELLESLTSLMATFKMPEAQKVIAEALLESSDGEGGVENVAQQQRIYVLQDQLDEANFTIEELKERLAQYESYDDGTADAAEDDAEDAGDTPESRESLVQAAIGDAGRFQRLRFLTNSAKPLADFGKRRPYGSEIVAALDAIDTLAQAWYNSPGGSIGNWDNYFMDLKPGWTHANGESSFTMSRYGDKRSFSDQEQKRRVTIERHLTYQGSNSGLQIFFDRDDATDKFIVGYIGEHLPYATNRS